LTWAYGRRVIGDDYAEPSAHGDDPAAATPATSTFAPSDLNTYAWALVLLPLVPVAVAWWAPQIYVPSGASSGEWIVGLTLLVTIVLAYLDEQRLRAAGIRVSAPWAVFLVPLYLMGRTRAARSPLAIPILWFVTFVFSVYALSTFLAVYRYDGGDVGRDVAHQLQQQQAQEQGRGGPRITVACPEIVGHPGNTFTCSAHDSSGQTGRVVVSLDASSTGGYHWYLSPS
jgi:hypothetical protein